MASLWARIQARRTRVPVGLFAGSHWGCPVGVYQWVDMPPSTARVIPVM
jgi:hypothetical protein